MQFINNTCFKKFSCQQCKYYFENKKIGSADFKLRTHSMVPRNKFPHISDALPLS